MNKVDAQRMLANINKSNEKSVALREGIKNLYKKKFNEGIDVDNDSKVTTSEKPQPKSERPQPTNEKPASEKSAATQDIVLTSSEKAMILKLRAEKKASKSETAVDKATDDGTVGEGCKGKKIRLTNEAIKRISQRRKFEARRRMR